jgi:hypothetical protein
MFVVSSLRSYDVIFMFQIVAIHIAFEYTYNYKSERRCPSCVFGSETATLAEDFYYFPQSIQTHP